VTIGISGTILFKPMRPPLPTQDLDLVLLHTSAFWSRFHGATVLLTGGTGFIGLWLLEVFQHANSKLNAGLRLMVLTRDPERARRQAPHLFDRNDTRLLQGNISEPLTTVEHLDLCIHAATDVSASLSASNPLKVFDSIVLGTRHVLDLARAAGATRFLLTSSGAIYGVQPVDLERIPENFLGAVDPLQPKNAYGNGKRAAEWLASAYSGQGGPECCIARIFAILGPGIPFDGSFAAGNFVRDVLAGRPIELEGDGRPIRSYLYMADLCIWLLRLAESGQSGRAYNVGSEHAVSITQLASQIAQMAANTARIHTHKPNRETATPPRYVPDTRRAREELGLMEYTPLSEAILKTINWSRSGALL
jgi:nucleoside-diphosphate-sugar epimerase